MAERPTVWITRPESDATAFAARMEEVSDRPLLVAPLITIEFQTEASMPDGTGAYAFTSANGVRALARVTEDRTQPCFCVGPSTASVARDAGFQVVGVADSSVESLAALIAGADLPAGAVCHVTGSHQAGNLVGALGQAGIEAVAIQLYRAAAVTTLPDAARTALGEGMIGDVVLFSPRTAEIFRQVITDAGLDAALGKVRLVCLSQAVADRLEGLPAAAIRVPAHPDAGALIDIVTGGST